MQLNHLNRLQPVCDPRVPDALSELAVVALLALFACFVILA
jgi:hypothetical protein